jgi:hypothetical protein
MSKKNIESDKKDLAEVSRLLYNLLSKRHGRKLEVRFKVNPDGSGMVQINDGYQYEEETLRHACNSALAGEALK